jgi:hypothetical protein
MKAIKRNKKNEVIMEPLLVYKTYPNADSAEEAAAILKENGIELDVREEARVLDSNYIGQQFSNPWLLYLRGEDFDRATQILEDHIVVRLADVDPGYMLLSFSDEELIEVMEKKDEWGIYNYKLAEMLLKQKDKPIPEVQIAIKQAEHLKIKEQPVSSGIMYLILGYLSVLAGIYTLFVPSRTAVLTLMQGLLGLFAGWSLSYHKRTLSNGQRSYYFNSSTRLQGKIMLWTSVTVTVLKIILLIATNIS